MGVSATHVNFGTADKCNSTNLNKNYWSASKVKPQMERKVS